MSRRAVAWFGAVSSLLVLAGVAPAPPAGATVPKPWASRVIALPGGAVASMAGQGAWVYALTRSLDGGLPSSNPPGIITRLDLSDLRTRSSQPIGGVQDLAVVGRSLWVSTTTFPAGKGSHVEGSARIERFSASTLERTGETLLAGNLPSTGAFSSLVSVPGGPCWASVGPHLYRLDPVSGRVLSTTALFFDIESLSENPGGSILYAAGEGLPSANYQPPLVVQQLDALSGTVLASSSGVAVAGGSVSAAPHGVWVSARSGMAGASYQLRQGTLALIAVPTSPPPADRALGRASGVGDGPYDSIGGVQGVVSDHVLWLSAFAYLACADPSTEAVRGYELINGRTAGHGALVAVGRRLFLGGVHGISVIQPPGACFS